MGAESSARAYSDGERRPKRPDVPVLLLATITVGVVVAAVALVAAAALGSRSSGDPWRPVLQEIVKVGYQALAVGALGGMAKLLIDRHRSHAAAKTELREQRRRYIAEVVAVRYDASNARTLLRANRSVHTWSEQVNGVLIPARNRLRRIAHDLADSETIGAPVFGDRTNRVKLDVEAMAKRLHELIDEFADHKQRLSELQRRAEHSDPSEREALLGEIWDGLQALPHTGDFVNERGGYDMFRGTYRDVVRMMRETLAPDARP